MPAPSRADAWKLLTEYVSSPGLRRHCLAVEAAMRVYARKYGGAPDEWGIAGLLHDFDYEKYPVPDPANRTGHPFAGERILRERGYPETIIRAILGHATYSGIVREAPMEKCLFACDELCGFITAAAYVRPGRLAGLNAETVKKCLAKKKFAEKVNRAEIAHGIAELGVPEDEHISTVIAAMQAIAADLGF